MSDQPLFQNTDEQESVYAPQQVPGAEQERVRADDKTGPADSPTFDSPPAAAPVANLGNAPSAAAAPPGIDRADIRNDEAARD